jgi:predicted alpha/beta hydrolase family esterase
MQNAIILHGKPSRAEYYTLKALGTSNDHWLPWLQAQLLKRDIAAVTPEMPRAYAPDWDTWVREIERYDITPETILVGHSCGGGFWVRYLSERPHLRVGKVVLIAPWIDPDGDNTKGFFDFTIDPDLASRTQGLIIFHSDNDMGNVHKSVAILREQVKDVQYQEFHKYGHFTARQLRTQGFPELLEVLVDSKSL